MDNKIMIKLNDLYTQLEYETDKTTIAKIKRQIRQIENKLNKGVK